MEHIRNTIMQHEALFKEQVQALHKLYSIQKSAMQEIRRIHSQDQILACNSKCFVLSDDRYGGSDFDGKHLRQAYVTSQAYNDKSLNLSLHPFYVLDYKGCGSLWMDSRGVETLQTAQSKPTRNFDLERLPEEYMNESENQIEPNSSKMSDENCILLKRSTNTSGDSSVVANFSVIQVDSSILKQIYPGTNLRTLPVNDQKIIQNCDGVLEDKACTTDIKKFAISFSSPNSTNESQTSQDFPRKCLPAVGKSGTYQDSRHIGKQKLLHEGSLSNTTPKYNPVQSEKDDPEKIPEQANGHIVEGNFLKNLVISSQGSSTLDSVQCDSTCSKGFFSQMSLSLKTNYVSGKQDLNSFPLTSQTSIDHTEVENPNGSDNGSNSIQSQYTKSCKDDNGCCDAVQTVQSECEEGAEVIKDGINPCLSCTMSDSEIKHIDPSMYSNSKSTTVAVTEGNELLKDKSALRETCESIAAEILLSMAPNTTQVDFQLHGTRVKVESGKLSKDNMISDKKWNPCHGRQANYCQGGGASESMKWANTVNRRRTKRRPR